MSALLAQLWPMGRLAVAPGLLLIVAGIVWLAWSGDGPEAAVNGSGAPSTQPATFPTSANERIALRRRMVEQQIANPRDQRDPVNDKLVIQAMLAVPRHAFVPESLRDRAYEDSPLPIGHGQTISQPYIVALMTQHLRLTSTSKVLEIGTGSGYQAAVLAHLTPQVYTIEIVEDLARTAQKNLKAQGYTSVQVRAGDGYLGWPEHAPFDAIIVTCAPERLPQPLWDQLKPGGRIVIPIGAQDEIQQLVVISKTPDGQRRSQTITAVRFVPMTGR